jgi:hypothetical protein
MQKRLVLALPSGDFQRLAALAEVEDRGIERQAAHIIRQALRGLEPHGVDAPTAPAEGRAGARA